MAQQYASKQPHGFKNHVEKIAIVGVSHPSPFTLHTYKGEWVLLCLPKPLSCFFYCLACGLLPSLIFLMISHLWDWPFNGRWPTKSLIKPFFLEDALFHASP